MHERCCLGEQLLAIWCFRSVFCGPGSWAPFLGRYGEVSGRSFWADVKAKTLDASSATCALQSTRLGCATALSRVALWGHLTSYFIDSHYFPSSAGQMTLHVIHASVDTTIKKEYVEIAKVRSFARECMHEIVVFTYCHSAWLP